jgi:hypothetical protein
MQLNCHKISCAESFDVRLVVWSANADRPYGTPGDDGNPALDYTSKGGFLGLTGACGVRERNDNMPYKGARALQLQHNVAGNMIAVQLSATKTTPVLLLEGSLALTLSATMLYAIA